MVSYLTPEQVLFIHARLVVETGGAPGLRDLGLILSAVARPQATLSQQDLYSTLPEKAAALFESLVNNHPFLDGNKRAAITAAGIFLQLNQYRLAASNEQVIAFTLQSAQGLVSFDQMIARFQEHTQPFPNDPRS